MVVRSLKHIADHDKVFLVLWALGGTNRSEKNQPNESLGRSSTKEKLMGLWATFQGQDIGRLSDNTMCLCTNVSGLWASYYVKL